MQAKPRSTTLYINGRFLSQQITGVQRYAREVIKSLDTHIASLSAFNGVSCILLTPPNADSIPLSNIEVREVGVGSGHFWEQAVLPVYARSGMLLSLNATGPIAHRRQMVTVHDAAVYAIPNAFGPAFRAWYQLIIPTMLRNNAITITVSEFSAQELVSYTGVDRSKIRISGAGWQHIEAIKSDTSILQEYNLEEGNYMLAVGSTSPHKNFNIIGQALDVIKRRDEKQRISLVVAGGSAPHIFSAATNHHQQIQHVGYVSNESLVALYKHAAAFIFPSRYEGFGLPPLEAMAVGCPVICSRSASLPEVCGDAPIYFDSHNPEDLADAITQLTNNSQLAHEHRTRGYEVLKRHSWDSAAEKIIDALTAC